MAAADNGITMKLVPEDDYRHPIEAAGSFNESMYVNVFDRANPIVPAEIDLVGVSPLFGGEPINADGSPIEQKAEASFARAHTEQHTRGTGTIKVGTETFTIIGLGLRGTADPHRLRHDRVPTRWPARLRSVRVSGSDHRRRAGGQASWILSSQGAKLGDRFDSISHPVAADKPGLDRCDRVSTA
jgi:hypothetical protein